MISDYEHVGHLIPVDLMALRSEVPPVKVYACPVCHCVVAEVNRRYPLSRRRRHDRWHKKLERDRG